MVRNSKPFGRSGRGLPRWLPLGILTLVLSACQTVDAIPVPAISAAEAAQSLRALGNHYVLGSGDQLRVSVFKHKDLTGTYLIDDSGRISFPLVGPVDASGRTVDQFQSALAGRLSQGFLVDPKVTVQVDQYRPFFILGGVERPGAYEYQTGITILSAIALAGGHSAYAIKNLEPLIIRASDATRSKKETTVHGAVFPGDIVEIPEARRPTQR